MPRSLPRRILQQLPAPWAAALTGVAATPITTGMSGAEIFRLRTTPDSILKLATGKHAAVGREEIVRMRWLACQRIAVPTILYAHADGRIAVMQMEKLPGLPADRCRWPAGRLLPAIGRALAALHAVPVDACPFDERLAVRLDLAQRAVNDGEVDIEQFDEKNQGVAPQVLLQRLLQHRPIEDIVVTHGDAAFSNIIVSDERIGFIDCGHVGRADRYLDLAVTAAEIVERFGRNGLELFARAYGEREWNERKATYYCDLYEFF
jgi:aminoglycoside 3'-phosphotransferase-2